MLDEDEEEETMGSEKISLDSDYLKSVLGTPLTYALLEIASKRPTDPIQYLSHYLVKWRWSEKNKKEYEKQVEQLTIERTAYMEKMRELERQKMLAKEQEEEEIRRKDKLESIISDYGEVDPFFDDLI